MVAAAGGSATGRIRFRDRLRWPSWPVHAGWSLATSGGVGLLLAGGMSLFGVAVVLLALAPDRDLLWQLWRAPVVEPVLGFQIAAGTVLLAWAVHPVRDGAVAAWLAGRGWRRRRARTLLAFLADQLDPADGSDPPPA